ncbi:hypothetical protein IJ541_02695 [bacterium]|nr:hypothetical protein [bacterium]
MKKIIIMSFALLFVGSLQAQSACNIDKLDVCTTIMGATGINSGGINKNLEDKILPNNLNKRQQPNSRLNNRGQQGQSKYPGQINRDMSQQESTQPYDANCQFGNCINQNNLGGNQKR